MTTRSERTYSLGAAAALLAVLVGPLSAWAHAAGGAAAASGPAGAGLRGDTGIAGLVIAAAALAIASGLRRPRRLAAGLVVVVAVFAFEEALHAAHHAGDPRQAAACTVAVATGHLHASPVDAVELHLIPEPSLHPVPSTRPVSVTLRRPAPHEGRAPPPRTV